MWQPIFNNVPIGFYFLVLCRQFPVLGTRVQGTRWYRLSHPIITTSCSILQWHIIIIFLSSSSIYRHWCQTLSKLLSLTVCNFSSHSAHTWLFWDFTTSLQHHSLQVLMCYEFWLTMTPQFTMTYDLMNFDLMTLRPVSQSVSSLASSQSALPSHQALTSTHWLVTSSVDDVPQRTLLRVSSQSARTHTCHRHKQYT